MKVLSGTLSFFFAIIGFVIAFTAYSGEAAETIMQQIFILNEGILFMVAAVYFIILAKVIE